MKIRPNSTCLVVILTLAGVAAIRATTINTYTFTQTGYQNPFIDSIGTVTGEFAGIVENSGRIELDDLESFWARFEIDGSAFETQLFPFFFTFDTTPGAGVSTLGIAVSMNQAAALCIGAPAAFQLPPCAFQIYPGAPSSVNGSLGTLIPTYTSAFPTVELVSSLILNPPQPFDEPPPVDPITTPADAPEPATSILLGLGLCGLRAALRRVR